MIIALWKVLTDQEQLDKITTFNLQTLKWPSNFLADNRVHDSFEKICDLIFFCETDNSQYWIR